MDTRDGYLSVGATSVGVPLDGINPRRLFLTVETAAIRFRYDGHEADGAIGGGHLASDGDSVAIDGAINIKAFRMIRDTSTNADVYYTIEVM